MRVWRSCWPCWCLDRRCCQKTHNPCGETFSHSIEIGPAHCGFRWGFSAPPSPAYTFTSHWLMSKGISGCSQADVKLEQEPCEPQINSHRNELFLNMQKMHNALTAPKYSETLVQSAWQASFLPLQGLLNASYWLDQCKNCNISTYNQESGKAIYAEMQFS